MGAGLAKAPTTCLLICQLAQCPLTQCQLTQLPIRYFPTSKNLPFTTYFLLPTSKKKLLEHARLLLGYLKPAPR
jgi:hypothetical protein